MGARCYGLRVIALTLELRPRAPTSSSDPRALTLELGPPRPALRVCALLVLPVLGKEAHRDDLGAFAHAKRGFTFGGHGDGCRAAASGAG